MLPYAGGTSQEDLYGFRTTMNEPAPAEQAEADAKAAKSNRAMALLPMLIILVLLGSLRLSLSPNSPNRRPRLFMSIWEHRDSILPALEPGSSRAGKEPPLRISFTSIR